MAILADKRHSRTMNVLLGAVFLMHFAYYLILPLLPIFLKMNKGLSVSQIGIVLAVGSFSVQAGSLAGGMLSDWFGRRAVIALGACLRGAGLIGIGTFAPLSLLVLFSCVSGFGGGLHAPAIKAAIAALVSAETDSRTTAFAWRGVAANIGIGSAGLIVFFLLTGKSAIAFYLASGLFVLLGLLAWALLPADKGATARDKVPIVEYKKLLGNRAAIVFFALQVMVWALYAQFALTVPIRATVVLHDPGRVGLIWTINSLLVILLQNLVAGRFLARLNPMYALAAGVLFIGGGVGIVPWASGFGWLTAAGVVFIIGEMIIMPTLDASIARMAGASLLGLFFGLASLAAGMGEGIGNVLGGQLLRIGNAPLISLLYACAALAVGVLIAVANRWSVLHDAFDDAHDNRNTAREHLDKLGRGGISGRNFVQTVADLLTGKRKAK